MISTMSDRDKKATLRSTPYLMTGKNNCTVALHNNNNFLNTNETNIHTCSFQIQCHFVTPANSLYFFCLLFTTLLGHSTYRSLLKWTAALLFSHKLYKMPHVRN